MNIAEAREKIRTTQLVNRVQDHALGKVEMTATQVTAALGLLDRCVPKLNATDLRVTGQIELHAAIDRPTAESRDEWLERRERLMLAAIPAAGSAE